MVSRIELAEALSKSGNEYAAVLLELLQDPTYQDCSLAKLCRLSGLRYFDLFQIYRQQKLNEAMVRMVQHVPEVAENTIDDAMTVERPCGMCGGKGYRGRGFARQPCPYCEGWGTLRRPGNPAARRLVFEAVGLTPRPSQINITQRNPNLSGSLEPLEATLAESEKVLSAPASEQADQGDSNEPNRETDTSGKPMGTGSAEESLEDCYRELKTSLLNRQEQEEQE